MRSPEAQERKRERNRHMRREWKSVLMVGANAVRCPSCGGKVAMPCRLCAVRRSS